ncbi:MAG: SDR family oxidoreductase [Thermoleophilia bacterium]
MTGELAGQHALVTGGGTGIGRACAVELARRGASITVTGRRPEPLAEAVAEIEALGGRAFAVPGDMTVTADVDAAVSGAASQGDLAILVACAGYSQPGPTVEIEDETYDRIMDLNVRTAFLSARAMGRHLLARGKGGRIVLMGSQMGHIGYPGRMLYCTAKHALEGMAQALGVEWARAGITVNTVAPTFILTPLTEPFLADEAFMQEVLERRIPMGRIGTLDEVAHAVAYLCSPAASLTTGSCLKVDGGWTAW